MDVAFSGVECNRSTELDEDITGERHQLATLECDRKLRGGPMSRVAKGSHLEAPDRLPIQARSRGYVADGTPAVAPADVVGK